MSGLDETHDPERTSWIEAANAPGAEFPVQNLPLGVFRPAAGEMPRGGVAIGDRIVDLGAVAALLEGAARRAAQAGAGPELNPLLAMGDEGSAALRLSLSRLLSDPRRREAVEPSLSAMAPAQLLLPARIGDYTDFYASVHHATNVGALFRPDNPLLPNYKWVPIAYHGRASTVRASGAPVRRPKGQLKPPQADEPVFGASRGLDYEVELAAWVGEAVPAGASAPVDAAERHVFGFGLLNDWSARDIQAWEYQPLGPFLAKNFASTVSPWIVTRQALEPFRVPAYGRPEGDPRPLPYLWADQDQRRGGYDIRMEALLLTEAMRGRGAPPARLSRGSFADIYWTVAQMAAHHTSNGCDLNPGDLLGSGTVSGPDRDSLGSLLELTRRGAEPVRLPSGESRGFLEDGDEVILRAHCERQGFRSIGFGECRGRIVAAD